MARRFAIADLHIGHGRIVEDNPHRPFPNGDAHDAELIYR